MVLTVPHRPADEPDSQVVWWRTHMVPAPPPTAYPGALRTAPPPDPYWRATTRVEREQTNDGSKRGPNSSGSDLHLRLSRARVSHSKVPTFHSPLFEAWCRTSRFRFTTLSALERRARGAALAGAGPPPPAEPGATKTAPPPDPSGRAGANNDGTPTLVNWRPLHALQFYIAFEESLNGRGLWIRTDSRLHLPCAGPTKSY